MKTILTLVIDPGARDTARPSRPVGPPIYRTPSLKFCRLDAALSMVLPRADWLGRLFLARAAGDSVECNRVRGWLGLGHLV